jgi:hypothetical protein
MLGFPLPPDLAAFTVSLNARQHLIRVRAEVVFVILHIDVNHLGIPSVSFLFSLSYSLTRLETGCNIIYYYVSTMEMSLNVFFEATGLCKLKNKSVTHINTN